MKENKSRRIAKALLSLGVHPNTKGYHYLKYGIDLCLTEPEAMTKVHKRVYTEIAETYGTTTTAVERAIRFAIKSGWNRRVREQAGEFFGMTLQSDYDIPSNSLFIAAITDWLLDTEEEEKELINV